MVLPSFIAGLPRLQAEPSLLIGSMGARAQAWGPPGLGVPQQAGDKILT
jgi:hypothetical protein